MTTSATMAHTIISEKPMSNMRGWAEASGLAARLAFLLVADLTLDGGAGRGGGDFARGLLGLLGLSLHAVLEALHGAAQVGAHVAQLLRAENQQHDEQHDQPMPDAERTHCGSPGSRSY